MSLERKPVGVTEVDLPPLLPYEMEAIQEISAVNDKPPEEVLNEAMLLKAHAILSRGQENPKIFINWLGPTRQIIVFDENYEAFRSLGQPAEVGEEPNTFF